MVSFPEMRHGRIALSFATLLARSTGAVVPDIDYATPFQAHAVARGQLAYYRALEAAGEVRIITEAASLNSHLAEWKSTSPNHMDAVALLKEVSSGKKGRDRAAKHLKDVIEEKNRAAYEGDAYRARDVEKLQTHVVRFRTWCRNLLA